MRCPSARRKRRCHSSTVSRTRTASSRVWGRISGSLEYRLTPEGHGPDAGQRRVEVQDAGQGVLERGAVVDPGADDDLTVHLDAPVEQHLEPAQAGRALGVAQHLRPQLGVRGVDGDEQWAEALGQDAFRVELGEPGERREVAVEEGQPVVVVLEVQAAPHALGQLVDEAERAVVVTRADAVEDGRGDLDARAAHPAALSTRTSRGSGAPARRDQDAEVVRVAEPLEIDDVARLLAVEAQELVAHGQSGPGCRRRRGDRSHRGS